jgi:hypothetical protein
MRATRDIDRHDDGPHQETEPDHLRYPFRDVDGRRGISIPRSNPFDRDTRQSGPHLVVRSSAAPRPIDKGKRENPPHPSGIRLLYNHPVHAFGGILSAQTDGPSRAVVDAQKPLSAGMMEVLREQSDHRSRSADPAPTRCAQAHDPR